MLTLDDGTGVSTGGFSGSFTVHLQDAVKPFEVFAIISAVPADTALTIPLLTVATLLLLLLHVTVLSVAFDGLIVALIVLLSPIVSVILEISSSILDGITVGSFTVHLQDAVKPFAVFAMISAVPADTALTFPSSSRSRSLL